MGIAILLAGLFVASSPANTARTLPDGTVETLVTSTTYDANDRVNSTTFPDGSTTATDYNSIGQIETSTDPLGRITTYTYDTQGRQTRVTHPDGLFEETTYDVEGQRIAATDRAGRTTTFEYDPAGRLTKTIATDGAISETVFDAAGQVAQSIDPLGNATHFEYDASGRRIKTIDALGNETSQTYDDAGNLLTMTDALARTATYLHDTLNRRIRTTHHDGTFVRTEYDALGRRIAEIDQAGIRTEFAYDDAGRLLEITDAQGGVTRYEYDELGNQTEQIDALGRRTSFTHDRIGRRLTSTLPLGQSDSSTYDAAGNVITRTDFNGRTTSFAYDNLNRLISKTPDPVAWPGSVPVEFTYTATGQRATMSDVSGLTTYQYDMQDRLVATTTPEGGLENTYDAAGNLLSTTSVDPEGIAVTYTHDPLNRLASVSEANLGLTSYTYTAVGSLHHAVLPNGTTTTHQYDSLNRLVRRATTRGADLIADFQYTRATTGHRLTSAELIAPQPGPGAPQPLARSVSYTYDTLYRLTSETISPVASAPAGATSGPVGAIAYTHDAVGNRLTRSSTVAGNLNQVFSYDLNDRLAHHGYDDNGNTLTGSPSESAPDLLTSDYNFENRLVRAENPDGSIIETAYNGDAQRVRESVTAGGITTVTTFLIDNLSPSGWPQVVEERVNGTLAVTYTYGHDLIAQDRKDHGSGNWTASFYGYDGHGSVRFLTDALGQITDTVTYDAFGERIHSEGATANNYLYAGQQFAPSLGLYYNRARFLSANHGRFWNQDVFEGFQNDPQSLHKYLYAHGDPVNGWDPSGYLTIGELAAGLAIRVTLFASRFNAYAYSAGGAALARYHRALGRFAQRVPEMLLSGARNIQQIAYNVRLGSGKTNVDFVFRVGRARHALEAKYSMPTSGDSLQRLASQVRIMVNSPLIQEKIVWTLQPPTRKALNALQRTVGPDVYSQIKIVSGVEDLVSLLKTLKVTGL